MKKSAKKYSGSSPMKWVQFIPLALQGVSAGISFFGGRKRKREAEEEQREQEALFNEQLEKYTSEVYENPYEDMQNVYEDMTVDQRASEFQRDAFAQQQANLLQALESGQTGAGAAAVATAMSRAGAQQARKASIDIAQQERQIQQLQLGEEKRLEMLNIAGQQQVDQLERARTANLANMYGQKASQAQLEADAGYEQMMGGLTSGIEAIGTSLLPGGVLSDALSGLGGAKAMDIDTDYMEQIAGITSQEDKMMDILTANRPQPINIINE